MTEKFCRDTSVWPKKLMMNVVPQNLLLHKLVILPCDPLRCLLFGRELSTWHYVLDEVDVLGSV